MSKAHVKEFYQRLANDTAFKTKVEASNSQKECTQIVQEAGYIFTPAEFEEFTSQCLNPSSDNECELEEAELEVAVGGIKAFIDSGKPIFRPVYGLPPDDFPKI